MKSYQKPDSAPVCLSLMLIIAILAVSGCTESSESRQDHVPVIGVKQGEFPVAAITITKGTVTTEPSLLKDLPQAPASQPAVASDPSERAVPNGILIDGIPDITAGDPLVVSGRTSLPVGTNLIVQVVPVIMVNGKITGDYRNLEKSATTKVAGGSANGNRYSVTFETTNLLPAEHIVSVSDLDDEAADRSSGPVGFTGSALFSVIAR